MPEPLKRGRHSVLYNYGVGKTFFHERSQLIEEVVGIQQDPQKPLPSVNVDQLRARLRNEVRRFVRADLAPEQVRDVRVNVFQPDWVVAQANPPAFYCQRCGHLYIAGPKKARRAAGMPNAFLAGVRPDDGRCTCTETGARCGGRVVQYNILTTHNCGASVFVPAERGMGACPDHAANHLHWLRQGSERAARWRIRCMTRGCAHMREAHQSFFAQHWGCPLDGVDDRDNPILARDEKSWFSAPYMKATHYMGRVLNLLNSDNSLPDLVPGSEDARTATLGVLRDAANFRVFDPGAGLDGWRNSRIVAQGVDLEKLGALKKEREALASTNLPAAVKETVLARYDEQIAEMEAVAGPSVDLGALDDLLAKEDFLRQVRDTVLYMESRRGFDLDWLRRQYAADAEYAEQLDQTRGRMTTLGIHDIRYQDQIPLTAALVGYTRGSYDARKSQLKLFMPEGYQGGVNVFANQSKTEGIWVQLDPVRTVEWLARRTKTAVPTVGSFPEALFTLQQRFRPESEDTFGTYTDDWVSSHYALLHTMSHLFIKAAGRVSGLEQEGIAEEVLPYSNSFVIYANHSGEFVLGGLQLTMEYHLPAILNGLSDDAHRCVYSPVCETRNAWSCHGCVHLGEVSCTNFNRTMGRQVLVDDAGFWT